MNTGKYRSQKTPYLDTFHAVHQLEYRVRTSGEIACGSQYSS